MTLLLGTHFEMYLLIYVLKGVIYIQLMLYSLVCNLLVCPSILS